MEEAKKEDQPNVGDLDVSTEKKNKSQDQGGVGGPNVETETPTHSFKDILIGTHPKKIPGLDDETDPTISLLGLGLGTSILGGIVNALPVENIPGLGTAKKLGAKVLKQGSLLTGVPQAMAQIEDIIPHQVALRWEGAGTPGWFRQLTPKSESSKSYEA